MTDADRKAFYDGQTAQVFNNLIRLNLPDVNGVPVSPLCFVDDFVGLVSNGITYEPVGFELNESGDKSADGTATLSFIGATNAQIQMAQEVVGENVTADVMFVRRDAPNDYLIAPTQYDVTSIGIVSSTGTITISMKISGNLGFYASKHKYDTYEFGGMEG